MGVREELERFRQMGNGTSSFQRVGRTPLFSTIGRPEIQPVRREYVLQLPGAGNGRPRRTSLDVRAELDVYARAPTARDEERGYSGFAGEFFRREPKTADEARKKVADLRITIERAREDVARANTRIATEEKRVVEAEKKIRDAEESIGRLQRAFELEGVDRRRAVAILGM
jgi:hypothetical protein